jgi:hypothetical protein
MGEKLAGTSMVCGVVGLPLWLLSYTWLPFAWAGRDGWFVWSAVVVGEIGALAAGALGVGLGITARMRFRSGTPDHRRATRGLLLGAIVLGLVLVPNIAAGNWSLVRPAEG